MAALAPKLRPELLHRVIDAHGLEDCVELVAQATPAQISHLFDMDLWRADAPRLDEHFDPARFGVWINVLAEAGADVAAAKLAGMPVPQLVAALTHHVRVYDVSSVSSYETMDGSRLDYSRPVRDRIGCEIGGFHVAALRDDAWDAVVGVLAELDASHPDDFVTLMRAIRSRSHSPREQDGFHDLLGNREQMMFDAAEERERRRRERGFASPADARAFLQMSRSTATGSDASNPIARDYARSFIVPIAHADDSMPPPTPEDIEAIALLADSGILPLSAPRALIESGTPTDGSRLERFMRVAFDRDEIAYGERTFELTYLANVLVAGCQVQGRPFTPKEAADAAAAVCSLGLDGAADLPEDYLLTHDLIGVFQAGWRTLFTDICLFAARTLVDVLAQPLSGDADVQAELNLLRVRLVRACESGTPWRALPALEVLMHMDVPAWAALCGLLAECPVLHAGLHASVDHRVRSVEANRFTFIATSEDLALVREFFSVLPTVL